MLKATIVTDENELLQIHELSQQNLKTNLDAETKRRQGFVTWLYSVDLLKQIHKLAPSIIVKDGDAIAGYALTTLKESSTFHADLKKMFHDLEIVQYKDKPLTHYHFYCMGQICVAKHYRGQGVVQMLYDKHKEVYSGQYEFILTEISTTNARSLKAHAKIGFEKIYTYTDEKDEWNVVVWDWK
jgi:ribosomal protein S18 acetylase RimI-like enzyme